MRRESNTWICDNCGAVQEGNIRVRFSMGDVTGCSKCVRPDPKIVKRVWKQILLPAVDRQLREKFGFPAADLPWEIVTVLGLWMLGGPRKTMEEELQAMGVTSSVEELIENHTAKRQAAVGKVVTESSREPKRKRSKQ